MNEREVKFVLENYLKDKKIEYKTEQNFPNTRPDFVFKNRDKICCVEAKGEDSELYSCLGEILNYFSDFSHVYLCAPLNFLNRFLSMVKNNPELKNIEQKMGLIEVKKPSSYFYATLLTIGIDIHLKKKRSRLRKNLILTRLYPN